MKISNVRTGINEQRTIAGKPDIYISWHEGGKIKYKFFFQIRNLEKFKNELIAKKNEREPSSLIEFDWLSVKKSI